MSQRMTSVQVCSLEANSPRYGDTLFEMRSGGYSNVFLFSDRASMGAQDSVHQSLYPNCEPCVTI